MNFRKLLSTLLCLSALSLVYAADIPPATSAAPEDPALTALRTAHLTALKSRQDALLKKELAALRALEAARVEQEDYAGADAVAQALLALEKSSAASPTKAPSTMLSAHTPHQLSYGALERNGQIFINKANGSIRWDGLALAAGRYQVNLIYSVDAPANGVTRIVTGSGVRQPTEAPAYGGSLTFSEITSINGSETLKFKVPRTTMLVEKTTAELGFITTTSSRTSLILKAVEAYSEGLMTFHGIELVPVSAPQTASPGTEAKEFATYQEEYRKQMQEKTTGAHKAWLVKLQELMKSATESANTEALTLIKPEITRVSSILNPAAPVSTAPSGPISLNACDPLLATFNSEIRISNTKDCLQRLRPAGARVSFKLAGKVAPGNYHVALNLNEGAGMGGTYSLTCGSSQLSGSLEGKGALVHHTMEVSKTLVVPPDAKYLEFSVESLLNPSGSLCELRSIDLTPEK